MQKSVSLSCSWLIVIRSWSIYNNHVVLVGAEFCGQTLKLSISAAFLRRKLKLSSCEASARHVGRLRSVWFLVLVDF